MPAENEKVETRSGIRLQFSLFALLLLLTLACVFLGWWQFIYLERQHLLARRDVLAQKISETNQIITDSWEMYLDIARDSQRFEVCTTNLMEIATKQLDRLDLELLRLESQFVASEVASGKERESALGRRIIDLRDQRIVLQREIERRSEPSVELEMLKREIERLQQVVDDLTHELTDIEIEIETRGLSATADSKKGR